MKNLLGILFALLLLTGSAFAGPHDLELKKAQELFVQIACSGPHYGLHRVVGTGFPVAEHMVGTARHIDCGKSDVLEVSSDGHLWEVISEDNNIPHGKFDMRVLITFQSFKTVAKFCSPVLGEDAISYGIADGNLMSVGTVVKITPEEVTLTNMPVGGLSGSAIIGEGGCVIGMTSYGRPEMIGDEVAGWVTGALPSTIMDAELKKLFEALTEK